MYQCLRDGVDEAVHNKLPWLVRPKAHMLQHLCEEKLPLWGAPSRFWSYRDESFIGAVKIIAARSKKPELLEQRILEKLLILAGLGFPA
jgi:hypothetical protein